MATGKPVILTIDFQNVDRFLQSDLANGFHQGGDFCRIVAAGQRSVNAIDGDIFDSHNRVERLNSLKYTRNEYDLQFFVETMEKRCSQHDQIPSQPAPSLS